MISIENSVLTISGAVNNRTAPVLLQEALKHVGDGVRAVDLQWIDGVDSSAVSLLLHLQRAAETRGQSVHVQNVPDNLRALVHLYDLDETLCPLTRCNE